MALKIICFHLQARCREVKDLLAVAGLAPGASKMSGALSSWLGECWQRLVSEQGKDEDSSIIITERLFLVQVPQWMP